LESLPPANYWFTSVDQIGIREPVLRSLFGSRGPQIHLGVATEQPGQAQYFSMISHACSRPSGSPSTLAAALRQRAESQTLLDRSSQLGCRTVRYQLRRRIRWIAEENEATSAGCADRRPRSNRRRCDGQRFAGSEPVPTEVIAGIGEEAEGQVVERAVGQDDDALGGGNRRPDRGEQDLAQPIRQLEGQLGRLDRVGPSRPRGMEWTANSSLAGPRANT
jgi:hypothetical protein